MLERLAGHEYYCFLDGYLGYIIRSQSYLRTKKNHLHMSLRNICIPTHAVWFTQCSRHLSTIYDEHFQRHVEQFLKIFMDDFSIRGSSFDACLPHLKAVLTRCEEKQLILNWKNITLWSNVALCVVSKDGIEVNKAKNRTYLNSSSSYVC